ncbi:hypothetical protein PLESTB_001811100 [Pleodorina starrii]|uniref:Uncharacterized protein n=1 Tax=Pleodorina starrii TaxID=330485 RepID=A0A9W6FA22_9CHLO|nr:hypothetical protein PLESTM_000907400 [Pleodorina starrii]GLC61858.1 hypothetical protein PLESTB_001811100 [Pleodorina starrii]GLC76918.1 hypothetical protein PLESTF_001855400 [Pleodorina starrii]
MLLKHQGNVGGRRIGHARGAWRRAVSIPRAQAQAGSLPLPLPSSSIPLSYRSVTTDPVFRPAAASDQQYAPGGPQLLSRHLTLNPLHGLAAAVTAAARRLDLAFAATMDRRPLTHALAAAATAALTYLGLHPLSLARFDLPAAAADWIEARAGDWAVEAAGAAALAAGLAAALWQLRNWVAAQAALIRFDQVVQADLATAATAAVPGGGAAAAAPSAEPAAAAAAAAGPFAALVPAPVRDLFEGGWKRTDKTWLLLIMAARLGTLLTAANSLLYGNAMTAAAFAALCFGASLLPLALPHVRQLLAATGAAAPLPPAAAPGGAAGLAAAALLSDAAFLLALAPSAPAPARAAGAVALAAASAAAAMAAAASTRLAASTAAAGDVATFHVIVRLPLSGTLIDTTLGHRPLTAVVGEAAGDDDDDDGDAAAADPRVTDRDPQARFRPIQAAMSSAVLQGMFLGERRTVLIDSGDGADSGGGGVPFRNPGLVWWQPLDDLQRKVGSRERMLRAGDVFWYPVGSLVSELGARRLSTAAATATRGSEAAALPGADSWGPVEVCAVSEGWVQLDANAGLKGGQAEVEVQLVALQKKAGDK